jgi:hypothetical protein
VALEQVARLEQTIAQAERTAPVVLSPEERTTLDALAQDLPAIWHAATTTNRERKQLVRFAITAVDLDGRSQPGKVAIQIHWHSGTITTVQVDRPRPGEGSLQTPVGAVALICDKAPRHPYHEIAEQLNAQGWRTAFGRRFTSQHVGYLCRRYGWARGTCHRQGGSSSAAAQDAAHPGS